MISCWHRKLLVVVLLASLTTQHLPAFAQEIIDGTNFDGQLSDGEDVSAVMRLQSAATDLRVRHFEGDDSVGFQDDATTFELFREFWSDGYSLWYLDGRLGLTNNTNVFGNGGIGFRRLNSRGTRTFGGSLWFDVDGRFKDLQTFHQLALGVETQGEIVDLGAMFYKPIGDQVFEGTPIFSPLTYQGNNLVFTSATSSIVAMEGLNLDGTVHLPIFQQYDLRGSAGWYHFQADGSEDINGFRGRLEISPADGLDLMVVVQNDDRNDTTAFFGLGFTFSKGSSLAGCHIPSTVRDRMTDPVFRNYQVVIDEQNNSEQFIVRDATTQQIVDIVHVDSAAPAGGDGTFENPFNNLTDAAAVPSDIVLAYADSVFVNESMIVQPSQRFLGEGQDTHLIDTLQRGIVPLPRASMGTNRPEILASLGNAVVVGPNSEVSGFQITDPVGAGIFADSFIGDVDLSHLRIDGAATDGVFTNDVVGNVMLEDVDIDNSIVHGLFMQDFNGSLSYSGGNIASTTGTAIRFDTYIGDATFDNVAVDQTDGQAVVINQAAGGPLDFSNSTFDVTNGPAFQITNTNASSSFGATNVVNSPVDAVFLVLNTGTHTFNDLNVTTTGAGVRGLFASITGTVNVTGTSSIASNGGAAVQVMDSGVGMTFDTLASSNSNNNGILLDNVTGTFDVTGGTDIMDSTNSGINIFDSNTLAASFAGTTNITGTGVPAVDVGHGVFLNNNPGSTFTFANLNIMTDNGGGLIATDSGTVNVLDGTIDATGGPAVDIDPTGFNLVFNNLTSTNSVAGPGHTGNGVNFDASAGTLLVNGTTTVTNPAGDGISITNVPAGGGQFTFTGATTITNPGGDGINLNTILGNSLVDFGAVAINGRGARGIDANNVNGTFNFGDVNIAAPMAGNVEAGIDISNSPGTFTFASTTVTNSLGAGVSLNNNTGNIDINGGQITGATGVAFDVMGGNSNVTYQGSINNGSDRVIRVANTTGGSVTFPTTGGTITDTAGTGILLDNVQGDFTASNGNITNSTSTGVDIQGGTGTFTFNSMNITNAVGTGFNVDGGNAVVSYTGDVNNAAGRVAAIQNTTGGSVSFMGGSLSDNGGLGLLFQNANGNVNITNANLANTNAATSAVDIIGGSGTYSFTNALNIANSQGVGFNVVGSNANVIVAGGTVTGTVGTAFNVDGGGPNIEFGAAIDNTSGRIISIQNTVAGNIGFPSPAIQSTGGEGILVNNSQSTVSISNAQINNTTGPGVELTGNGRPLTFSNIDIDNILSSQPGFVATNNTAFISVSNGSTIQTTGATALQVTGVSIAQRTPLNMTFQTVSAGGGGFVNGINLTNVSDTFTITGVGAVATSGGTIAGATGDAISITNAGDIALNLMSVTGAAGQAVSGTGVAGFSLDSSSVTTSGGVNVETVSTAGGSNIFNLSSNNIVTNAGDAVNWMADGAGTTNALISGNTLNGMDEGLDVRTGGTSLVNLIINGNNITANNPVVANGAGINLHSNSILNTRVTRNTIVAAAPNAFQAITDANTAALRLLLGEIPTPGMMQTDGNTVGNDILNSEFILNNAAGGTFELGGNPFDSPQTTIFANGNRTVDLNPANDPDNAVNSTVIGTVIVVDPATTPFP